jgi:pimeloyl-ACP methyl ester carboxylesterase
LSLVANKRSPSPHISYYHRPHTSKTHLPVLYIHGVGILHTYINFLAEFNRASDNDLLNGEIGLIVLEIKPISFCITHAALSKDDMCAEILSILQKHNWEKFVLMANSYGTIISTQLLKNVEIAPKIGPVVFIDPIPFLMHLPELVYNFLYRLPRKPSEHQLYYFASTDMGAAHTLARRMFWSDNILWKEDVEGRKMTVMLSERDIIVDAKAVGRYLTREKGMRAVDDHRGDEWKRWTWKGEGLDVLWFDGLNHAELFDAKADREILIRVLMNYCKG